jgi:Na+-driven multidrug efflux pump
VAALTQPATALAFVLDGLILGIADYVAMRRAMILAVFAYLPLAALVLTFHGLGLPGIWVALGAWLTARAVLLGRRWNAEFAGTQTSDGETPSPLSPPGY